MATNDIFITLAASNRGGGKGKSKCEKCEGVDINSGPFKIFVEDLGVLSLMINTQGESGASLSATCPHHKMFLFF